jgi:hypothetical protein
VVISLSLREWRNWQTRTVQVRVPVRAWGFKSPLAHNGVVSVIVRVTTYKREGHREIRWPSLVPSRWVEPLWPFRVHSFVVRR